MASLDADARTWGAHGKDGEKDHSGGLHPLLYAPMSLNRRTCSEKAGL